MDKSLTKEAASASHSRFPCQQCGALLTYEPGTQHLQCNYCGQENAIPQRLETIQELDLHQALIELANAKSVAKVSQIQCNGCGADFKFADSIQAGECPFCGTAIVKCDTQARPIAPKSLLPFKINEQEAKQYFQHWLKGLWFAPNVIKKSAHNDAKLKGVYIPYWTFDSHTETAYHGARGRLYYVDEPIQTIRGGQVFNEVRREPKIDWTPVSGMVSRFFDDVLVGASKSLPRQILDRLEPWDLENLAPFDDRYLSGFTSEYYQVALNQGFDEAKLKMDNVIYHDIAFDIGGDQQRIDQRKTQHSQTTYKHCLLPVWSAAFRYRGKSYHFIINGRTGQVQGERPYSVWKIAFAVIFGLIVAGGLYFYLERSGQLRPDYTVNWQPDVEWRQDTFQP